ncbi:MAG: glycogen synthase GlgA [Sandaracinaceae bacterium]
MAKPKVLFVASECAPFAKMGGLADVAGALPRALARRGFDVRVVLPRYAHLDRADFARHPAPVAVPLGDAEAWCAVYEGRLPNSDVPLYLLDHDELFARGYIYDPPGGYDQENLVRFALLNRGAFSLCRHLGWHPDVFHVHDWPTALVPIYVNTVEREAFGDAATVLTIHNLAHQGFFGADRYPITQLPWSELKADGLEHYGLVNMLKGGLYQATKITTVSPRYAHEIQTAEGGHGLDHVTRWRAGDLIGILNGIDEDVWNPATDPFLPANYDLGRLDGKAVCKAGLQREMGLEVTPDRPLCGAVSRLHYQKGLDMLAAAAPGILEWGAQIVVLGSGDADLEGHFRFLSDHGGDRFRAYIGFDEALAHRIEGACDFFFMPSRFEPCGLNQMYSQRYGTLPIVRAVGGLDDSVESFDPATGRGTGFKFHDLTTEALLQCSRYAMDVWWHQPLAIHLMREQSMQKKMGWDVAAVQYEDVYRWAIEARRGRPYEASTSAPSNPGASDASNGPAPIPRRTTVQLPRAAAGSFVRRIAKALAGEVSTTSSVPPPPSDPADG